ncbi:MAG: hypothetical protein BWY59_02183 [Verrucomicrobia bacterium ADurb.Bin345]|nr:MAG: hypothetical protein BWY59_02183 [Verrucomicrobia bacterium ADurb.Bin345]
MPAVVVRHHGDGHVADFRLAREFCLSEAGHADDVEIAAAVEMRLGLGGKRRALHVDVGSPVVDAYAGELAGADDRGGGGVHMLPELVADGVAESDVGHDAVSEERMPAPVFRAVEILVEQEHVARPVVVAQAAHGADGDDAFHAELLEPENVRPVVDFGRENAVAVAVPGEEEHLHAVEHAAHERVRRRAERGFDFARARFGEAFHVVQAGPADDADLEGFFGHVCVLEVALRSPRSIPDDGRTHQARHGEGRGSRPESAGDAWRSLMVAAKERGGRGRADHARYRPVFCVVAWGADTSPPAQAPP